ncbi:pleckstrin homology domain-containing family M member 3 [Nephila pilipes]|uniref:Pleckstrin homology domain-containing family M member 3 n=1 Tax=Nephila pilipes TaxID=299642 RepID=A0A8X6JTQ9_NEPPI|nr:pleckstrin homology domain-containing family M member 3 [Nephila pilipes]
MDLLWKKTALPSIEDFAKEIAVKKNLTLELSKSIRVIQEESLGKSIIPDNEYSSNLCSVLEAIFIHGLKDKITRKMSAVFGSNPERIPEPQFWTAVYNFSHKNVILEINHFSLITTDVGRGRAWLRAALNDGLIVSYVGNMLSDQSGMQKHYNSSAYLRDDEQSDIMKKLLEGLNIFTFELSCNNSTLNVWNSLPLTLANIWTPPVTPQPVMPAVDVIDFFTDPKNQTKTSPRTKKSSAVASSTSNPSSDKNNDLKSDIQSSMDDNKTVEMPVESKDNTIAQVENESERKEEVIDPVLENLPDCHEIIDPSVSNLENLEKSDKQYYEEISSKISSSDSVPDFGIEIIDGFSDQIGSTGNKLSEDSGWSSTFDCDPYSTNCEADQSYDSLLQSYNKNLSKVVIGTPELADTFTSVMQMNDDDCDNSPDAKSPDSDFEFVPKYLAVEHADEETKKLMEAVGKVCPEKGLMLQDFKCNSCGRPIGMIYGKSRLCYYDGYNYCYECHENETEFIPARIVHNWDFKQYPVSKRAKIFIARIDKDPLLDIKVLNPAMYTAIEEMAQMQLLRTQLTFLRSYIFTCKESIAEDLRKRLWPREYLYEHVHLYSITDMLEIASGALAQTLLKVIAFAKKHVMSCQLCLVKGFICEVCKNPKPIYPFDVETTYHCDKCLAVYHAVCMDANKYCPKCIRKMKRQQLLESTTPD